MELCSKKMAIITTSIYVVGVFYTIGLVLSPESESLSGVPAIILTLPWSLLLMSIFNLISPAMGTDQVGLLIVCFCAFLNAVIIYRLFR